MPEKLDGPNWNWLSRSVFSDPEALPDREVNGFPKLIFRILLAGWTIFGEDENDSEVPLGIYSAGVEERWMFAGLVGLSETTEVTKVVLFKNRFLSIFSRIVRQTSGWRFSIVTFPEFLFMDTFSS